MQQNPRQFVPSKLKFLNDTGYPVRGFPKIRGRSLEGVRTMAIVDWGLKLGFH